MHTIPPGQRNGAGFAGARAAARGLARAFNRRVRRALAAVVTAVVPLAPSESLPAEEKVKRVLVVRANFRMGNVVLSTSLLPVLQARFPHAQIDWLVSDTGARLLEGLPVHEVLRVSRSFIWQPWRFVQLCHELRRNGYDVAIDGAMTSFSGACYAWLSGARHRVGGEGRTAAWLTSRLDLPPVANVYAATWAFGAALGVAADGWPSYVVKPDEAAVAQRLLGQLRPGMAPGKPLAGVFIGGHGDKRWPLASWRDLVAGLAAAGMPALVFVGTEEAGVQEELAALGGTAVTVVPPQPLRQFAALVARTRLLVTPDSGPMHLAAALRVPVVAVLQKEGSRFFVPPGGSISLLRPTPAEVLAAVRSHPGWNPAAA